VYAQHVSFGQCCFVVVSARLWYTVIITFHSSTYEIILLIQQFRTNRHIFISYFTAMSSTLDFISIAPLPGTHTFFLNVNSLDSLVTRPQVQTLYQQQTPHLQSNTQTHLDIRHSNLGYNIQFKHWNFRTFSIQSLATNSGCPLARTKFIIRNDLQLPTVKEEISRSSSHCNVRISVHPNELIVSHTEPPIQRRLRRYWPHDLLVRF
jgi:hypothetical protein